jgi:hypothetical protein
MTATLIVGKQSEVQLYEGDIYDGDTCCETDGDAESASGGDDNNGSKGDSDKEEGRGPILGCVVTSDNDEEKYYYTDDFFLLDLLYDHTEAQQHRRATLIDDIFGNMRL